MLVLLTAPGDVTIHGFEGTRGAKFVVRKLASSTSPVNIRFPLTLASRRLLPHAHRPISSGSRLLSICAVAMSSAELSFEPLSPGAASSIVVGRKANLLSLSGDALPDTLPGGLWAPLVNKASPGDAGASASTLYVSDGEAKTVVAAVLPEACSRHNSPLRPHAITSLVGPPALDAASAPGGASIIAVLDDAAHAGGAACAM